MGKKNKVLICNKAGSASICLKCPHSKLHPVGMYPSEECSDTDECSQVYNGEYRTIKVKCVIKKEK